MSSAADGGRSRTAAAPVVRSRDDAGRCLPPDAAVHGTGRCTGDLGCGNAHGVSAAMRRRGRDAQALRSCTSAKASQIQAMSWRIRYVSICPMVLFGGTRRRDGDGMTDWSCQAIAWLHEIRCGHVAGRNACGEVRRLAAGEAAGDLSRAAAATSGSAGSASSPPARTGPCPRG